MSEYTIEVNWHLKDGLSSDDPGKIISGNDFYAEFEAIREAISTKADNKDVAVIERTIEEHKIESVITSRITADSYIDLVDGDTFLMTVHSDNNTLSAVNMKPGNEIFIIIKNTGDFRLRFSTDFLLDDNTISVGADKVDLLKCVSDGGVLYCNMNKDLKNDI
jgi:hypothetical protein